MFKALATRSLAALLLPIFLTACGGGDAPGPVTPPVLPPVITPPVTPPITPPVTPPVSPPVSPPAQPSLKYPIPAGLWSAPGGAAPATGNYVYLQSTAGDYIGSGRTYVYTNAQSLIKVTNTGLTIKVDVDGNQDWDGGFMLPSAAGVLQAGYFQNLTRTPFADPSVGGVEWSGEGRGCNTITGWVVIDKVVVNNGVVESLDLRFQQGCEGSNLPLYGQIHWNKADENSGRVTEPLPIPGNLWRASASAVPATGNYVFLESSAGDYIGRGNTYLYKQSNAVLGVTVSDARLGISVGGNEDWTGDFQPMLGLTRLSVGYYPDMTRFPFHNPVLGGMSWSGDGRGCNRLGGWFAVDKVTYTGNALTELDMRFEQHCDGSTGPLRGQVRWSANDPTKPSGPLQPAPINLWKPDASFVPPAGNYVFLVSDYGDYIGGGRTELLMGASTPIKVDNTLTAAMRIDVGGWSGEFFGMTGLSQLQPGYYGDLQRYPFHNTTMGGMNWSGNGRGCNRLSGWFVVDHVSYSQGQMTAIDLRFEQHCDGNIAAQRGVIHWVK